MSDPPHQAFVVSSLHQDICADHWRTNSRWKKKIMINRSFCTSVTSVFKTSGHKWHFWSYAGASTIMKRLFSHQNKEKTKKKKKNETNLNMQREIGLQILKCHVFPLILRYRLKTAFLFEISWSPFACITIWCLPIYFHKHFWKKIHRGYKA